MMPVVIKHTKGAGKRTVLVVDDEKDIVSLLEHFLHREFDVKTAHNGQEALRIIADQEIDCVISDYMMPGMNGRELLDSIRASGRTMKTVIHSATHPLDCPVDCDLRIDKPTEFSKIVRMISDLLDP